VFYRFVQKVSARLDRTNIEETTSSDVATSFTEAKVLTKAYLKYVC